MKFTISLMLMACFFAGFSQLSVGSIKFFTEEGEKFSVYLNGELKNAQPSGSVKVEVGSDPTVHVKIVFEDKSIEPISKSILRWGNDESVLIKKNKKGMYETKIVDAKGGASPQQSEPMQTSSPAPATGGPLTASYADGVINLSDGRHFEVKRSKLNGMSPYPQVEMKAPMNASVHFTYDATREEYKGEVPFVYSVQDYNNNNSYFKMDVTETNGAHWFVKMQNGTGYKLTIE